MTADLDTLLTALYAELTDRIIPFRGPGRGLGQVKVAGDLAHRPVTALAQLNDLGLELRRERAARPGLLPPHALHGRTSFRGRTPDDGCPSKRAKPRSPRASATRRQPPGYSSAPNHQDPPRPNLRQARRALRHYPGKTHHLREMPQRAVPANCWSQPQHVSAKITREPAHHSIIGLPSDWPLAMGPSSCPIPDHGAQIGQFGAIWPGQHNNRAGPCRSADLAHLPRTRQITITGCLQPGCWASKVMPCPQRGQ